MDEVGVGVVFDGGSVKSTNISRKDVGYPLVDINEIK